MVSVTKYAYQKASHNLYNEAGMSSLFSIRKLIGNMFFDSFFDTINPREDRSYSQTACPPYREESQRDRRDTHREQDH